MDLDQREDFLKIKEQARKKKFSAEKFIAIGRIILTITIALAFFDVIAYFGAKSSGMSKSIYTTLGFCVSVAIVLFFVGIVYLLIGLSRQKDAFEEITAAEQESQATKMTMIAEEEKKS